ncbi:MAG: prevent-host-death family protein [Bacteroidetes bacterium CG12_big_fil_rev_8_21_14_0_65_60_17]|nr:MAG: prevent-host-death family protein [Bacteroidetes bacterium CG12_big_fil_rev_8_21_14_0_65_60_17]
MQLYVLRSISELRKEAAGIVKNMALSSDPVVITQRGRAAAVMVSAASYERSQRELEILKILIQGEKDIVAGATHSMEEVFEEADRILDSYR